MPQKSWAVGEEVLAADFNSYIQNQCVPAFTGTTQRDSQWAGPPNGALCVTVDTNTLWLRQGGAWQASGLGGREFGYHQTSVDVTGITQTRITVNTVSFTLAAQRRVHAIHSSFVYKGGADAAAIVVCELAFDGTVATSRSANVNQSANLPVSNSAAKTLAAGAHTIIVQYYNTASYMNVGSAATLMVQDMGPA